METKRDPFNRVLLTTLIVLFILSIAAFSYANYAVEPGFMKWWMALLNILILSIPLALLFGSIYVLVSAWREYAALGQVSPRLAKAVRWAPRVAAILIIFFISLFSLDVFESDAPLLEVLGGFIIHSIPSIILIVLLIFAWKRPVVGFISFLVFGVLFAARFVRSINSLPNLLLFVFPILLISSLFYADWKWLTPKPAGALETTAADVPPK